MADDFHGRNAWLSENAYRSFPFEENSSFTADDGVDMPLALVRDFKCVVVTKSRAGAPEAPLDVRLKAFKVRLSNTGGGMGICVMTMFSVPGVNSGHFGPKDRAGTVASSGVPVFSGYFGENDGGSTMDVMYRGFYGDDGGVSSGSMCLVHAVLGLPVFEGGSAESAMPCIVRLAERQSLSDSGWHSFSNGPKVLGSRVLYVPGGVGVDSLAMRWGPLDGSGGRSGVMHVQDGRNTEFRVDSGELYLTAYSGAGKGFDCEKRSDSNKCKYVHFINGQHAGTNGYFSIVAGNGVSIGSGSYNGVPGITVSTSATVDEFAKPVESR